MVTDPSTIGPFKSYGDHATGSGPMMFLNGAQSPSVFFWQQSLSVVPNHDYTFSAWVADSYFTSPAIVDFHINGTSVGTLALSIDQMGQWIPFQVKWNSGANTIAKLSLFDLETSADGNDFTLDDISFVGPSLTVDTPEPATLPLLGMVALPVVGMVRCNGLLRKVARVMKNSRKL